MNKIKTIINLPGAPETNEPMTLELLLDTSLLPIIGDLMIFEGSACEEVVKTYGHGLFRVKARCYDVTQERVAQVTLTLDYKSK